MDVKEKLKSKKIFDARNFKRLLVANGYQYKRSNGDHMIYSNGRNNITFTTRNLNRMIVQRLIKENGLLI